VNRENARCVVRKPTHRALIHLATKLRSGIRIKNECVHLSNKIFMSKIVNKN
jgi:hypothetical protein